MDFGFIFKFRSVITIATLLFFAPIKTKAQDYCNELTEGTAHGLQCLQCMHPKARGHAERYTEMLLRSCQKNIAIAYSLDGAFGYNLQVISKQVDDLFSAGREVNLHLYLLNGPAQRRWFKKTFKGFANQIPPDVFRAKILKDKSFQDSYKNFVRHNLSILDHAWKNGVTISVVPMLEDNLTNSSFNKLLSLTKEVIPEEYQVKYVRNACSDCYPGNEFNIPGGILKEDHTFTESFTQDGGYVSNDGTSYVYFTESQKLKIPRPVKRGARLEESVSLDQLIPKLKRADKNEATFLLWLNRFQSTLPGSSSDRIGRRLFPVPTDFEVREVAKFLAVR